MQKKGRGKNMNKKDLNRMKGEKLLHYSERDPKEFMQYDGFVNEMSDAVMSPDGDGDCVMACETIELMTGYPAVRLLVVPGTPPEAVVRLLGKMITWIQDAPEQLNKKAEEQEENETVLEF